MNSLREAVAISVACIHQKIFQTECVFVDACWDTMFNPDLRASLIYVTRPKNINYCWKDENDDTKAKKKRKKEGKTLVI